MTREEIARGLRCSASTGEKDCGKCPWGIREEFEGGVWESCDCDRMAVEAADLLENDGSQVLALQRELALRQAQLDCAAASAAKLRRQNGELREAAAKVTRLAGDAAEERRGQWNGEGDGYADGELVIDVWHCSNCDYRIDDGTDDPELLPKYCPGCGARMDGDSYGD